MDKAGLCDGKDAEPNWKKVCRQQTTLPKDVVMGSSIPSICSVDYGKAEKDNKLSNADGTLKTNLCEKYPEKCDKAATTYDKCAEDWSECVTKTDFHMCKSFPEMCQQDIYAPQATTYGTWAELSTAVCALDKKRFCRGSSTAMNMIDVCKQAATLPFDIAGGTAIGSLCFQADFEYICKTKGLCQTDIPKDLCERDGADKRDIRCDNSKPEHDACVADWQTCMLKPEWNFCAVFPDMCFAPPETFTVDDLPTIPADLQIDYGAPFFDRPKVGGSINFDYSDTSQIVTCEFELIEPISVAEKIVATQIGARQLPLFPGSEFTPVIQHGARVFASANASTSKKLVDYKNRPTLTFPGEAPVAMETTAQQTEKADFEKVFTGGQPEVGEIVYLGETEDFNLVELEGADKPPSEVVQKTRAGFAVV